MVVLFVHTLFLSTILATSVKLSLFPPPPKLDAWCNCYPLHCLSYTISPKLYEIWTFCLLEVFYLPMLSEEYRATYILWWLGIL